MQAFEFTLERALRWRSAQYEMESARLATLEHERSKMAKSIAKVTEARHYAAVSIVERTGTTGSEMIRAAQYRESAGFYLKQLHHHMRDCDKRIRQQQQRLTEAGRAKRLLEELRRREFDAWNYEFQREIENTAGELYLARWTMSRDQP